MANTPTQFCEIKMAPEGYQRAVYARNSADTLTVNQGTLVTPKTAAGLVNVAVAATDSVLKCYPVIDYLGDSTPDVSEINKVTVLKDAGIQIYTNNVDTVTIPADATTTSLGSPVCAGKATSGNHLAYPTATGDTEGCFVACAVTDNKVILGYVDAKDTSGIYITLA